MLVKLHSSTKGDNSFGFMYVLSMLATHPLVPFCPDKGGSTVLPSLFRNIH